MWGYGIVDWVVLGSGYVLALALFHALGGLPRAANLFRRWGSASAARTRHSSST